MTHAEYDALTPGDRIVVTRSNSYYSPDTLGVVFQITGRTPYSLLAVIPFSYCCSVWPETPINRHYEYSLAGEHVRSCCMTVKKRRPS